MPPMAETVRIQKMLADAGVASRRASEALVVAGRVSINGRQAGVGDRVDPIGDAVTVDGRVIGTRSARLYLVLNKPAGATSTVFDRHAERTVVQLVPDALRPRGGRIYPVGRLDRDSEGLLLLTDDGAWAQSLLHPRHGVEREYVVGLRHPLDPDQARQLERGIDMEEGTARLTGLRRSTLSETRWLEAIVTPHPGALVWYRAVLKQGWKRQLRRMLAAVDAPVERLVRVRIGTLRLEALRPGEVRALTEDERSGLGVPAGSVARSETARRGLVVSLDGPGSSGKSTVGAGAASRLGYRFCDTGVLYRALTWLASERATDPDDPAALTALVPAIELVADEAGLLRCVRIDGEDVTDKLHAVDVDREVSRVSRHAEVRASLLPIQRALAAEGRIIMAGRDIGTVVLPQADLKLYIDVSPEERARRRATERGLDPAGGEAGEVLGELRRRDAVDSAREVAPLRVPDGATIVRSDGNTLEETIATVVGQVRAHEAGDT